MLLKKYLLKNTDKIIVKGVIHVGAHNGEEISFYNTFIGGISKVLWIEGNPELAERLANRIGTEKVVNALVTKDGRDVIFNVNSNTQTSSIYETALHDFYYGVQKSQKKIVKSKTLSEIIGNDYLDYNFLNIDIQGAEFEALLGLGEKINQFDYIYLEVNFDYLYADIPLVDEITNFLNSKGFYLQKLFITTAAWGDALYIKGKASKFQIILCRITNWILIHIVAKLLHLIKSFKSHLF